MHCTLFVPDALLPAAYGTEPYADLALTALETALARGACAQSAPIEPEAWLCRAFGVAKQRDWPLAPLMASADGLDAHKGWWLFAEPAYFALDRTGLRVVPGAVSDLTMDEADALTASLNQHFAAEELRFLHAAPLRWYLCTREPQSITTSARATAANLDADTHLPRGEDARRWTRVLNEAQMVLHAHPVNARREARGSAVVNSLWISGGGTAPAVSSRPYDCVWSSGHAARALAIACGAQARELPADASALPQSKDEHHLIVLEGPTAALHAGDASAWRDAMSALERDWIAPIVAAVRDNRIANARLVLANEDSLVEAELTRRTLKRWWKRRHPLAAHAQAQQARAE
jgi:hypothetical protein